MSEPQIRSGVTDSSGSPELPRYLIEDILNRVEDARFIAGAQLLCKDWYDAGHNVRSLRILCLDVYHERERDHFDVQPLRLSIPEGAGPSTSGFSKSGPSTSESSISVPSTPESSVSVPSTPESSFSVPSTSSSSQKVKPTTFKNLLVKILAKKRYLNQLRIEVEPKLQSKSVQEAERRRTNFWIADPYYVKKWLTPSLQGTLQHVCIVDYGQQAILRRSKIMNLLSEYCKLLKTLDLRNMFIDTSECKPMPLMASFTLRCVKVVSETLQHINNNMPNLQTLALLGVFGAGGGTLNFQLMKVLCLGLSTPAKDVIMECPKLEKLQLKMQCPENLIIIAEILKYVAFNLDVMEPSKVELSSMVGLQELLYGAASFITLASLIQKNYRTLKKIFLDIPCMTLAEDGTFLGLLKDITLQLPSFRELHQCEGLQVLNLGPGLWHSMETQVQKLLREPKRPSMKTLILHMIPHDMEAAMTVFQFLLQPSVTEVVVFIHESSPMSQQLMRPRLEEAVSGQGREISCDIRSWRKSLDFSCFSF